MGQHRRRDLGEDHCFGTEPEGGQGLRQGASPHRQWGKGWLRRISDRSGEYLNITYLKDR